jgi:hypothetical protein
MAESFGEKQLRSSAEFVGNIASQTKEAANYIYGDLLHPTGKFNLRLVATYVALDFAAWSTLILERHNLDWQLGTPENALGQATAILAGLVIPGAAAIRFSTLLIEDINTLRRDMQEYTNQEPTNATVKQLELGI